MLCGELTGVVDEVGAVEAAHRAYYDAWERADVPALRAMWIDGDQVTLILPGGQPVHGRTAVFQELDELVDLTPGIQFLFEDIEVDVRGDVARLTCVEVPITTDDFSLTDISELITPRLSVSSIFVLTAEGWRMWHHQASPVVTHLDLDG